MSKSPPREHPEREAGDPFGAVELFGDLVRIHRQVVLDAVFDPPMQPRFRDETARDFAIHDQFLFGDHALPSVGHTLSGDNSTAFRIVTGSQWTTVLPVGEHTFGPRGIRDGLGRVDSSR